MQFITYEQFGPRFVAYAVTEERVAASIGETAGRRVEEGPMPAGPGGIAEVRVNGVIGDPQVIKKTGEVLGFQAELPIDLQLQVQLALTRHDFEADVRVPLQLTVRTAEPLKLVIQVADVNPADVDVDLRAAGSAAGLLQRIGDMESEVKKQVARTVNKRMTSASALAAREIDVLRLIEETSPDAPPPAE